MTETKHIFVVSGSKSKLLEIKKILKSVCKKQSIEAHYFRGSAEVFKQLELLNDRDELSIVISSEFFLDGKADDFFSKIKQKFPLTPLILISEGDPQILINSINHSNLFKSLLSNFTEDELLLIVKQALTRYEDRKSVQEKLASSGFDKSELIKKELQIAHEIQMNLLPPSKPAWKNLDMECYSSPAKNVGGDLYTYYGVQDNRVLISHHIVALGDVSGKGISAALLMATCLSRIDASMGTNMKLPDRAVYLDKILVPYTKAQKQNCALCMVEFVGVNAGRPSVRVVNAAGIPPYIKRANGEVEWLKARGFALGQGIGLKVGYKEVTATLSEGDVIILVSDGVIEANNKNNELLGFDSFVEIIQNAPADSAKSILGYIKKRLKEFTLDAEQNDDITIIVIRFHKD